MSETPNSGYEDQGGAKGLSRGILNLIQGGLETYTTVPDGEFKASDEEVARRAEEFYGMRIYGISLDGRFRLFHKALDKVDLIDDYETRVWRREFRALDARKQGEKTYNQKLRFGKNTFIQASAVFEQPAVKESIREELRTFNDPVMHIIDEFAGWADKLSISDGNPEISRAKKALDLILFSVYPIKLTSALREIAAEDLSASTQPNL